MIKQKEKRYIDDGMFIIGEFPISLYFSPHNHRKTFMLPMGYSNMTKDCAINFCVSPKDESRSFDQYII